MKRHLSPVLLLLVTATLVQAQIAVPKNGLKAISSEKIRKHLELIASDRMRGRNTPGPELDSCAAYIAAQFQRYGLKPAGLDGSYLQRFHLLKTRLGQPNTLLVTVNQKDSLFVIKQDFVPLYLSSNGEVTGEVVFAGYGITAPDLDYDDYQNIDVSGKIVLIFTHEPQEWDSTSIFDGRKLTDYSKLETKAVNARDHGAIGMLLITDPHHRFRRPPNPWPSLMRKAPLNAIPYSLEEKGREKLVAMRIGKFLGEYLLQNSGKTMAELQRQIDQTLKPQSFLIPDVKVKMSVSLEAERFTTQNVVGILEGRDPELKAETIVIGAHYDHLGARNDTTIFNGADDNASGTVGVLTLAEAFASGEMLPKRSILFCTWAGEEKGLFGSRYFVDSEPLIPLDKIVAYFNMDMIGRNDSGRVEVEGLNTSSGLTTLLYQANEAENLALSPKKSSLGSSDHASFRRKQIPVLGFFTGFHPDYHQPSDTADKCFPEGIAQICRLIFRTVWLVAEFPNRPLFDGNQK